MRVPRALGGALLGLFLATCGSTPPAAPAPTSLATAKTSASTASVPAGKAVAAGKKVRYGGLRSLNDSGVLIALDQGFFAEQGIDLELVNFSTAVDMVAPLSNGQLETGGGAPSAGLWNAVGRGIPVKVVADLGHADATPPGFAITSFVVRKPLMDSGKVKTPADLKGLNVVVPPAGNQFELTLSRILKSGGLSAKDINPVQLPITETAPALINGKVDAAATIEPFTTTVLSQGAGVTLLHDYDVSPNNQAGVLFFGPDFAKSDQTIPFMTAYLEAVRLYNDAFAKKLPEARAKVIKSLVAQTSLKDPGLYEKMSVGKFDPNGQLNMQSLQDQQEYFVSAAEQQKLVDLNTVVDVQYAKAAAAKLGAYS